MISIYGLQSARIDKKSLKTSTDKQVKDVDAQEDKQRVNKYMEKVQPISDQRDGNESSLRIVFPTY